MVRGKILVRCGNGNKSVIVPSNMAGVKGDTFGKYMKLISVRVPGDMARVRDYTF